MTSDPLAHYVLSRNMPLAHLSAWEDLIERAPHYENEKQIPPFRRPEYTEKPKVVITAQLIFDPDDAPRILPPIALWTYDGKVDTILPLAGTLEDGEVISGALLTHSQRGGMVVWINGSNGDFKAVLARYLPYILLDEYRVEPGAAGNSLRWLRITKSRHVWWWCDFAAVSGVSIDDWKTLLPANKSRERYAMLTPYTGWHCLQRLQRILAKHFHTDLRPTLASAAISALSAGMPDGLWLWRPPSLLVSMCRIGHGYRGGYCYAERNASRARKWDVNRLYSWALSQPLPARVAFGAYDSKQPEQHGIYMCTVSGSGRMPAYVGAYSPQSRLWRKAYISRNSCTTILPSAEIAGLRALGWTVEPSYGFTYTETFDFTEYVSHLESILSRYGRGSAEAKIARLMANMAYGRLAQTPEHDQCMYALAQPSAEWAPMLDEAGDELPYMWQRHGLAYRAAQHVEVAATIAAHGRAKLYAGFASVLDSGGRVVYADTDSIIAIGRCTGPERVHPKEIGAWRYLGNDEHCIIIGRKQYAFGGEARLSGYADSNRAQGLHRLHAV